MTSRLDPFFSTLFQQLNEQGMSYRAVCKSLRLQGVDISPQALRSWHVRKVLKIASRTIKMPPVQALAMEPVDLVPGVAVSNALPTEDQYLSAPARAAAPTSVCQGLLQEQIQEEEQKLLHASTATGFSGYLVPKKRAANSEPNQIQTTAGRQFQKGSL
jgi:hypothetical protein